METVFSEKEIPPPLSNPAPFFGFFCQNFPKTRTLAVVGFWGFTPPTPLGGRASHVPLHCLFLSVLQWPLRRRRRRLPSALLTLKGLAGCPHSRGRVRFKGKKEGPPRRGDGMPRL